MYNLSVPHHVWFTNKNSMQEIRSLETEYSEATHNIFHPLRKQQFSKRIHKNSPFFPFWAKQIKFTPSQLI
jgi:hypothetical protein